MVELVFEGRQTPPNWAVQQRELIAEMARAAIPFVSHSTQPDGSLRWRSRWTSMDGTDNAYEAFPLFAAAVLLVIATDQVNTLNQWLAVGFIGFRIAYHVLYLANWDKLRSLVWFFALLCPIIMIAQTATAL